MITGLAMAISVSLCMAMIGINDGFYQAFYDVMVTHRLGHIQIRHPDFAKSQSLYDTLENTDELLKTISELPTTTASTGRLYGNGLVSGDNISNGAQVIGVYPDLEQQFSSIEDQIIDGTYLSNASAAGNEEKMANARPQMIGLLDSTRHLLEELSPELGVTDPVSGTVVFEKQIN